MRKYVTYFLTSFATLFFLNFLLTGFGLSADLWEVLVMALFITAGIYLAQLVVNKNTRNTPAIFIFVATLINFFMIYIASLILPVTEVTGGALLLSNLGLTDTLANKSVDLILTLLIAALISALIAQLTKWSAILGD